MIKAFKITVFVVALFASWLCRAEEVKLKASLDSTQILIGDQVKLKFEIEVPAGVKVQFPILADSLGSTVEVVERLKIDSTKLDKNRLKLAQEFIVTSFDSGLHVIPAFPFLISYSGKTDTVNTNTALLKVYTIPKLDSIMNALKGPIDIKAPYEAPVTFKEVAPWILGTILAAGLIFLIFYYLKRRKENRPLFSAPKKPKEPAHIIALRKLDQIKEEKIWQQGKTKEYYSMVTDALREYIENRFGINALEQTSEETITAFKLQKQLLDEVTFNNLKQILGTADLVKFAKYEPLPDDNNLVLVNAYFFVNQTKIEVVSESSAPANDNEGDDVILN
jgi:hypothetical protein